MVKRKTGSAAEDPRVQRATRGELAKLRKMEGALRELLAKGELVGYRTGRLFDELARSGLYHHAYPTLRAYANATFPQGYSTLKRYRRIARAFKAASVRVHGVTKLDLLLDYVALTPEKERPQDLLDVVIRTATARVPFREAGTEEIEAAILHMKKPAKVDSPFEARAKRRLGEIEKLFGSKRRKGGGGPRPRVYPTDDGALRVDIVGIEDQDLESTGRALLALAAKYARKAAA